MRPQWEDDCTCNDSTPSTSPSVPLRQNAAVISTPPRSGSYWSNGSHQESHLPTTLVLDAGYWPNSGVDSHFPSPYQGIFEPDQSPNELYIGTSSSVPVDTSSNSCLIGMEAAFPVSDDGVPERGLSMVPIYPHPQTWTQGSGGRWDTASPWDHPVPSSGQFNDSSSRVASRVMQPAVPPFQIPSVTTGPSDFAVIPTSSFQMTASSNTVLLNGNDPVAVTPHSQMLGELSEPEGTATFQCMWKNRVHRTRCNAQIAGNRESVSSHLRDVHGFLCDGQKVKCAWDECGSEPMQRRNIPRHIVSRHFEIKVECPLCGLPFSRADAKKKHRQACAGVRMQAVMGASEEEAGGYPY